MKRFIFLVFCIISLSFYGYSQSATTGSAEVDGTSVTLNGTLTPAAPSPPNFIYGRFEYGTTTAYGTNVTSDPQYGFGGATNVDVTITLSPGTYHFRLAGSTDDVDYSTYVGNDNTFTVYALAPTTQAYGLDLNDDIRDDSILVKWNAGNGSRRIVLANTSNSFPTSANLDGNDYSSSANNDYTAAPTNIAKILYDGTDTSFVARGLTQNTEYYFKVIEYNNTGTNTKYSDVSGTNNPLNDTTLVTEPSEQAHTITFSDVNATSMTISWLGGNGSNSLVALRETNQGTIENPTDLQSYTATSNWTNPSKEELGSSGYYVIYNGTENSVSVTNLTPNTTYWVEIFEFNGSGGTENYYTGTGSNNPNNQSTLASAPTTQAHTLDLNDNIQSNSILVKWTEGNGSRRIVMANTTSSFPAAINLDGNDYSGTANNNYTLAPTNNTARILYDGTDNGTTGFTAAGLSANTVYYFKVVEYNNTGTDTKYSDAVGATNPSNTTTLVEISTTAASNIDLNEATMGGNITASGNGSISERGICFSFTSLNGNPEIGGSNVTKHVIAGTGTGAYSELIDTLSSGTGYSFKAFATNSGGTSYGSTETFTTTALTQATSITIGTITSTSVAISWAGGNGDQSLVVVREGTGSFTNPVDGTDYTPSSNFGSGDETVVSSGNYVLYEGSGNSTTINDLDPGTTYNIKVYEFTGTGSNTKYQLSDGSGTSPNTNPNTATTLKTTPSTQAFNITYSNYNETSFTVNWERGDGDSVMIVGRQGATVTDVPNINTYYDHDLAFTSGENIGNNSYVVYRGTGTSATVTGLTAGTDYYFRAYEFNNGGSSSNYATSSNGTNPTQGYTLSTEPTQASSVLFSNIGSDNFDVSWTNGGGTGRLVLARQGGPVSATPTDATTYTANTSFGDGDEIGSGNFVVYNGTSNTFNLSSLTGSVTYHVKVFEYDNTGAINYNSADNTGNPASQTTGVANAPTIQATNVNFTDITTNTFTVNWTDGNGSSRIVAVKQGSGTITDPSDNTTYSASSTFMDGDQLGTSGYYIVYNGTGSSVTVTSLTGETEYYVQVFEYNNSTGNERYLTTTGTGNPNNETTLKVAPTTQASQISFSNWKTTSIDVSWTNGNGENRICIVNTEDSFTNPTDGTDPTANSVYGGSGQQVVFNGSGNSLTVSGLTASTTYHFRVFEYNNSGSNTKYYTATGTNNPNSSSTIGPATWVGGDSGNQTDWGTGANWNIDQVPTGDYSATIPSSATHMPDITGTRTVDYLIVEAGAHVTISNGGSLSVNNNVTLEASSNSTPSGMIVIPGTGTLTVTGTSYLERYTPTTDDWHLVSVPITSPSIGDFAGYYVNAHVESTPGWINLNSQSTINVMQGVSTYYYSSQTLTFDGTFNNGNQSISVTNSTPGNDSYGWNLVGNPYPSAIDWEASTGWTLTNVDPTAYYYNASSGSYSNYNRSTSTGTGGGTRYIAAGQGFFIHASNNGTLGTTNAVRTSNSQSFRKNTKSENPMVRISAQKESLISDLAIVFFDGATDDFDPEFDAYKLLSSNENIADIYTKPDEETMLTIDTYDPYKLGNLENEDFTVPIGVTVNTDGLVVISASDYENIDDNIFIYLNDNLENKTIDLRESDYGLYLSNSTDDRFSITFSLNALSKNQQTYIQDLIVYTKEKTIFIKSDEFALNNSLINVYDISGRTIKTTSGTKSSVQQVLISQPGTYILKIIVGEKTITQKVVVQ